LWQCEISRCASTERRRSSAGDDGEEEPPPRREKFIVDLLGISTYTTFYVSVW
jgi:hypothetical protein